MGVSTKGEEERGLVLFEWYSRGEWKRVVVRGKEILFEIEGRKGLRQYSVSKVVFRADSIVFEAGPYLCTADVRYVEGVRRAGVDEGEHVRFVTSWGEIRVLKLLPEIIMSACAMSGRLPRSVDPEEFLSMIE